MVRGAAIGVPVWIVLLAALPATGLGVGACLALATGLAIAAVVVAQRLRGREPRAASGARPRRAMSPLAAAALTLGVLAVLVYVILVTRAA